MRSAFLYIWAVWHRAGKEFWPYELGLPLPEDIYNSGESSSKPYIALACQVEHDNDDMTMRNAYEC